MVLPAILQTGDSVCMPSQAIQQTTGATDIHVELSLNCVTTMSTILNYTKLYNRPRTAHTFLCGAASELCHSSDKVYSPPPILWPHTLHGGCFMARLRQLWELFAEGAYKLPLLSCPVVCLSKCNFVTKCIHSTRISCPSLKGTFKFFSSVNADVWELDFGAWHEGL